MADAGIESKHYIEWIEGDLEESAKRAAKKRAAKDAEAAPEGLVPGPRSRTGKALEALYIDALSADALKMSLAADRDFESTLQWATNHALGLQPDPRLVAYTKWVDIRLPDFSRGTWAEIHDVRESAAGRDFRRVLQRVSDRLMEAWPDLAAAPEDEVNRILTREFVLEAARDAAAQSPALLRIPGAAVLDLGVNLMSEITGIPSGALGVAGEGKNVVSQRRQWLSLLGWEPARARSEPLGLHER